MNRMNGHTNHEFICLLVHKITEDLSLTYFPFFSQTHTLNGMHDKLLVTIRSQWQQTGVHLVWAVLELPCRSPTIWHALQLHLAFAVSIYKHWSKPELG